MGRERTNGQVSGDSRSRSRSNSDPKREPFECRRNTLRPGRVAVIDINMEDRTVINPEGADFDGSYGKPGPHPAGCARIFFCSNEGSLDALEDYLEFGESGVPEDTEPRSSRGSWNASNNSENCPYDLRDLAPWICRHDSKEGGLDTDTETGSGDDDGEDTGVGEEENYESGHIPRFLTEADAIFTFTELCFTTGSKNIENAYGTLVQHKIYLFDSDDDDMITSKSYRPR